MKLINEELYEECICPFIGIKRDPDRDYPTLQRPVPRPQVRSMTLQILLKVYRKKTDIVILKSKSVSEKAMKAITVSGEGPEIRTGDSGRDEPDPAPDGHHRHECE